MSTETKKLSETFNLERTIYKLSFSKHFPVELLGIRATIKTTVIGIPNKLKHLFCWYINTSQTQTVIITIIVASFGPFRILQRLHG